MRGRALKTDFLHFPTGQAISETPELHLEYKTDGMLMSERSSHNTTPHQLVSLG